MRPGSFPILFIAPSRIGDAVLSSGLFKSLLKQEPEARFTIVASLLTAPLFTHIPGLDRLLVLEKRTFAAHWLSLWLRTWRQKWALVVDLRGSPISKALFARRRIAHRGGGMRSHKVIEAASLLGLEHAPPEPSLFTDPQTEARAQAIVGGQGPILALAPAANWVGKVWPADRFALLASVLLAENGALSGGRLMVLGGPADRELAARIIAVIPRSRVIDLVGEPDLLLSFAALKRARLFIGSDSGLMHMAAASGVPTLGLFGPSDERLYAPWSAAAVTVRGPRSYEDIRRDDRALSKPICHMMDLDVSTVLRAACSLLSASASVESVSDA